VIKILILLVPATDCGGKYGGGGARTANRRIVVIFISPKYF
jgi:hypothetical protein